MSHLQYYTYPGFGEFVKENTHYNQAVRVGDVIEVAGQGTTSKPPTFSSPPHQPHLPDNTHQAAGTVRPAR